MQISTQSTILSKCTGNDLTNKIANEPNFRKEVVKNINSKMDKQTKTSILYKIELENLKKYKSDISKYEAYNPGQLFNVADGFRVGIDVSFYDDIQYSASSMALRRLVLIFNKENPDQSFDLNYFNIKNNDNKVELLFNAHKFNIKNPDNVIDLKILENIFDLNEAKQKFIEHKNCGKQETEAPKMPLPPKKKQPIVIEKDVNDMSFGELADYWNLKHPKAQIDAAYIYAQSNKKIQEMIYTTSIYNLKFRNKKIPITLFTNDEFDMQQKDEILTGLKYNLKNTKNPIPVEKYIHAEIPADNMRIINKIMRLMAEYSVSADIDFIITNCTDRQSLNNKYEQLFQTK